MDNMTSQTDVARKLERTNPVTLYLSYLVAGILFGFAAIRSEIISWYRVQEMFRFNSFHMYGVIGSAVLVAALSVWLIKRFQVKTFAGEAIAFTPEAPDLYALYRWRHDLRIRLGAHWSVPRTYLGAHRGGVAWVFGGACRGNNGYLRLRFT